MDPLMDPMVIAEISHAWRDSQANDPTCRHEEGGYIVANSESSYRVERWARGVRSQIVPPSLDANNCYNGKIVVAVFHTHPNPPVDEIGQEWEQGPSESDRRWHVRRQLRGIIVGRTFVYEVGLNGAIAVLGKREEVFAS